jgi:hypothetical protein
MPSANDRPPLLLCRRNWEEFENLILLGVSRSCSLSQGFVRKKKGAWRHPTRENARFQAWHQKISETPPQLERKSARRKSIEHLMRPPRAFAATALAGPSNRSGSGFSLATVAKKSVELAKSRALYKSNTNISCRDDTIACAIEDRAVRTQKAIILEACVSMATKFSAPCQ